VDDAAVYFKVPPEDFQGASEENYENVKTTSIRVL
jgi:hypothetical protein